MKYIIFALFVIGCSFPPDRQCSQDMTGYALVRDSNDNYAITRGDGTYLAKYGVRGSGRMYDYDFFRYSDRSPTTYKDSCRAKGLLYEYLSLYKDSFKPVN